MTRTTDEFRRKLGERYGRHVAAIAGYDGETFYLADVDQGGGLFVRMTVYDEVTMDFIPWDGTVRGEESTTDPLSAYKITDMDDAGNPAYYGFMTSDGSWYIMENNTTNKTFRYAKGASGYSASWAGRAGLSYDYFNNVF